jgi:hypothetical protein
MKDLRSGFQKNSNARQHPKAFEKSKKHRRHVENVAHIERNGQVNVRYMVGARQNEVIEKQARRP